MLPEIFNVPEKNAYNNNVEFFLQSVEYIYKIFVTLEFTAPYKVDAMFSKWFENNS